MFHAASFRMHTGDNPLKIWETLSNLCERSFIRGVAEDILHRVQSSCIVAILV